jgi:lipopolysaccharide export system permease protein
LHRYLLRQIIVTLLMTAAVFTLVLLLGSFLREVLPLMISQKVSFLVIAKTFGLLIPFLWAYALPMGMLAAALLVFGRFSADQELTAARASGVSLLSLITPILILSLVLCVFSAYVNLDLAPRCRVEYNNLRFDLRSALANAELPEGRYVDFPGYTVYAAKKRKQHLEDVIVFQVRNETNIVMTMNAPHGTLTMDSTNQALLLQLDDAKWLYVGSDMPGSGKVVVKLNLNAASNPTAKPRINDMTFTQLQEELRNLQQQLALPPTVTTNSSEAIASKKHAAQKQSGDITEPIRVQIHRRVALSFACFGFTLIGIPLGIRMHRRETNAGVAVALGLVAVYYGLVVTAESMSMRAELGPHLLLWLPNFLFQAVGVVLLWRANRGI